MKNPRPDTRVGSKQTFFSLFSFSPLEVCLPQQGHLSPVAWQNLILYVLFLHRLCL